MSYPLRSLTPEEMVQSVTDEMGRPATLVDSAVLADGDLTVVVCDLAPADTRGGKVLYERRWAASRRSARPFLDTSGIITTEFKRSRAS